MSIFATQSKPSSRSVNVSGEGIAAAQFARCGFDVLVQAGHDKPMYDLAVTKAGNLLKISVKSSDNGRWCLVNPYLRDASEPKGNRTDCQKAIDLWLDSQASRTVVCLVQFAGVALYDMPRVYLASPWEIARKMQETTNRLEESALYETYDWVTQFDGLRRTEYLPKDWLFSPERIEEMLTRQPDEVISRHSRSNVLAGSDAWGGRKSDGRREVALTA